MSVEETKKVLQLTITVEMPVVGLDSIGLDEAMEKLHEFGSAVITDAQVKEADPLHVLAELNAADALKAENERLREALRDCMSYVDCDNLTMQTKHHNWEAVARGGEWVISNCRLAIMPNKEATNGEETE